VGIQSTAVTFTRSLRKSCISIYLCTLQLGFPGCYQSNYNWKHNSCH